MAQYLCSLNRCSSWLYSALLCSLFTWSTAVSAKEGVDRQSSERQADKKEIQGMSVMGNSELPKVLYLVPWQAPSVPSETADPPPTVLKEVFPEMNPVNHKNQVYFRKHLKVNVQTLTTH